METVVLRIDNPKTTTGNGRTLGQALIKLLTFWIPRASPDYEANLKHIKYWYVEVEKNTGAPEREIGFDITNRAILFAPTDKNYGLWTDSQVTFNSTNHELIDNEKFNDIFEALERHDFRVIESKINKYLKLWTINPSVKTPELPILIVNLETMIDPLYCKTVRQVLNSDVTGYEWEGENLIDKTGAVYSTDYINFGHPVGCVVPKRIERVLELEELKVKLVAKFKKKEMEINASRTFEDLFRLLESIN